MKIVFYFTLKVLFFLRIFKGIKGLFLPTSYVALDYDFEWITWRF